MSVMALGRCGAGPASFERVAVGEDGFGDEFAQGPNPCRALDGRVEQDPEAHHAVYQQPATYSGPSAELCYDCCIDRCDDGRSGFLEDAGHWV